MRRSLVVDDVAAKSCIHPCGREAIEENLVDVHGSGIFVIERRDELSWLTCCMAVSRQSIAGRCECGLTVVSHHVHTAGGKDGRLAGS